MRTILKLSRPLYSGPDPRRGGALVLSCVAGAVRCGVCGPVPAGDPLPAGRADHRLHRHVRAGVPGFSLWAPALGGWLVERLYGVKYAAMDFMAS